MKMLACCLLLVIHGGAYPQAPTAIGEASGPLTKSRVFASAEGVIRTLANGNQSRDIVHGTLASGESIGIHASTLMSGSKPSPLHTIQHSEFVVVQEGTLAFDHEGGTEKAGPGSIIFVAYGTPHRMRNIGDTPAKYVVIAIGGDQKK